MAEPFSPEGPRQLLTDLCRLVAERVPAEQQIAATFQARNQAAEKDYQNGQRRLAEQWETDRTATEAEYDAVRRETIAKGEAERVAVQQEYDAAQADVMARFDVDKGFAQQELQDAHWEATAVVEAAKGGSATQLREILAQIETRWRELLAIHQQAVEMLQRWGHWRDFPDPQPAGSLLERHPMQRFSHALELARASRKTFPA